MDLVYNERELILKQNLRNEEKINFIEESKKFIEGNNEQINLAKEGYCNVNLPLFQEKGINTNDIISIKEFGTQFQAFSKLKRRPKSNEY